MSAEPSGRFLKNARDVVLVLRLLVLAGLAMLGIGETPAYVFPFWFTVIVYGTTNLGYLFFGRSTDFSSLRTQRWVFLFDIVAVSLLIVLRGSQVPQFIMAYFTLVLMAAVVQGLGSALTNALFVCTVYAVVTAWGRPPDELLTFPVLSQFAFFVVVAIFMGQVAETAREAARRRAAAEFMNASLEAAVAERTADLTRSLEERDAARDRLHASDRLATVGMLSAGIAHEIRSPLAAIRACLDEQPSLFDDIEPAVRGQEDAERSLDLARRAVVDCDEACRQLQRVASDLTSLARGAPAEPRAVPAREALDATARLLRHRAKDGVKIVVLAGGAKDLLADPGRLQQALVNLAANGLDAMEGRGGTLTLAAEDAPDGRVRLTVEDTGCGIAPEVKARLFQPFVTTKGAGKGTGLGLHIVREIAEAHGASIEVESQPGVGTRFCVDWPAAPQQTQGDEHADAIARSAGLAERERAGGPGEDPPRGRRGDHPPGAREDVPARAL